MVERLPVPLCPVCGCPGRIAFDHVIDFVEAGRSEVPRQAWSYRRCTSCSSLWIEPCPRKDEIPALYHPNYFTHEPATQLPLKIGQASYSFRLAAKLAILEAAWGYSGLSKRAEHQQLSIAMGRLLARLPWFRQRAGFSVRFLAARQGGRLLDVGCGAGEFITLMQELGWQAEGIEPDSKAAAHQLAGMKVIASSLEEAELAAGSYDAITLHHALEHMARPKEALRKLIGCLRSGGVLVSLSPNPQGIPARLFGDCWRELDPPRHLVLPSAQGYRIMLAQLGLKHNVWTTMRLARWVIPESLAIEQTGQLSPPQDSPYARLLQIFSEILAMVLPDSGEEIVCIARKE